ncbi:MAG: hypothetical protein NT025_01145 [bacterium]|nr:hypothetical protein [bacterium]
MQRSMTRFAILSLVCALLLGGTAAQAKVRLTVVDVKNRTLQVEYQIEIKVFSFDTKKYFTFPDDGFSFADDSLKVVRVKNLESGEDLRWSLVPAKNDPNSRMLQVSHQVQLKPGQLQTTFTADLVVEGHTGNIVLNEDSTVSIRYDTSHETEFVVPANYQIVGTSERVRLAATEEGVVATTKGGEPSKLVFTIRACK